MHAIAKRRPLPTSFHAGVLTNSFLGDRALLRREAFNQ